VDAQGSPPQAAKKITLLQAMQAAEYRPKKQ